MVRLKYHSQGGAKQIHSVSESRPSQQGNTQSLVSREPEVLPAEATQRLQKLQAQNPVSKNMSSSPKLHVATQAPPDTRRDQSDVMERARAAIASADRATAAARADRAVELRRRLRQGLPRVLDLPLRRRGGRPRPTGRPQPEHG